MGRPSYSNPPSVEAIAPFAIAATSGGQSQNGGNVALIGSPIRSAPTGVNCRRCTTALIKCVVPIITASTSPWPSGAVRSCVRACKIPAVTSSLVGALTARTTRPSSIKTASVLVPPTSMPMRLMIRTPIERECRNQMQPGRRALTL